MQQLIGAMGGKWLNLIGLEQGCVTFWLVERIPYSDIIGPHGESWSYGASGKDKAVVALDSGMNNQYIPLVRAQSWCRLQIRQPASIFSNAVNSLFF